MTATNDPFVERYRLPGVGTPLLDDDIANKAYVDASVPPASMGDLEFLRDKQLAGDLVSDTGRATATGQLCAIIPANGKTFFISGSSFVVRVADAAGDGKCSLQNNTAEKDSLENAIGINTIAKESVIKSDSLVGDGAKEYSIEYTESSGTTVGIGTIAGWIQDT